jgi:hypothetical protein
MISRLALYYGSTWRVNCVVLSAILVVLILANLVVERNPRIHLNLAYALLIGSLLAIYFVPWQSFALGTRFLGAVLAAAYCLPLFFAGLVFTTTFRASENKSNAFGSNIIGAVAGGLSQNVSFVVGLKGLLLLAAIFYAFALLSSAIGRVGTQGEDRGVNVGSRAAEFSRPV